MYKLFSILLILLFLLVSCATVKPQGYDLRPGKISINYKGSLNKIQKQSTDTLILYVYSYVRNYFNIQTTQDHVINLVQEGDECKWPTGNANKGTYTIGIGSKCTLNEEIKETIIHETIHEIIGFTISANPLQRDYTWLVEGFTSYFALKIGLEMGLLSLDYVLNVHNNYVLGYQNHKYKNVSEEEAIELYKEDRSINYRRGYVLAFKWDMEVRLKYKNIITLKNYITSLLRHDPSNSTIDNLDKVSKDFIEGGVGTDIIQYAQEGDTIPISDFPKEGCIYSEESDEGKIFKLDYTILKKIGYLSCLLHF